ncbi:hypothetical protein ACWDZ8_36395 [Streptomyces sp. NPDC003233]
MTIEPPPADDHSSVSDDVWDQFLADSEERIRAEAPKEPSARARLVTARLRGQDKQAVGSGKKRRDGRAALPGGWRTGSASAGIGGGAGLRRRWRLTMALTALAAGVTAVALNSSVALGLLHRVTAPAVASAAGASPVGVPTIQHPFAGSPAEQWLTGPAGIVLPRVRAVGTLTQSQVAQALQHTKDYLVATNLESGALRGARPQAAFDLIDPQETVQLSRMAAALSSPSPHHDAADFFTRYDPSRFTLVGGAVRTHGTMTFAADRGDQVEVKADAIFVYPFTRTGDPSGQVARVIVRRTLDVEVGANGKLWVVQSNGTVSDSLCGYYDGYLRPEFPAAEHKVPHTGPAVDPYDSSRPPGAQRTCGTVTRT